MDDYYSYKPTAQLARPLVLAGLPGVDVGKTARVVNMLTGVPLVWLDRRASHVLGRSVEIASRQDRTAAERDLLKTFLARTPPVIATSHLTLLDPTCRTLLRDCSRIHLAISIDESLALIQQRSAEDPRAFHALREGRPFEAAALRPVLAELDAQLRALPQQRSVTGQVPLDIGRALLEDLQLMPAA